MKKVISFFSFLLILFFVFSCDLPEKIHIMGSPKLKFATDLDFSEEFREMMREAFEDNDLDNLVILDCTNSTLEWMTFLIRVGLVDYSQPIDKGIIDNVPDTGAPFTLPVDFTLIETETTLLFSEFGKFLEGFKFGTAGTNKIGSSFFINSHGDIFDDVKITLSFTDFDGTNEKGVINDSISNKKTAVIDLSGSEYKGIGVPAGGIDFDVTDFFNDKEDKKIKLKVFLETGTEYPPDLLTKLKEQDEQEIDVELVIWLPLVFEAEEDAEFILPGFEDLGDFLSSLATDSGDMIKSLNLEIGLNINPFNRGKFVARNIKDKDEFFNINMDANSIAFDVRPEDIDKINKIKEKEPDFETEFVIKFVDGDELGIPKELKIMSIGLEAEIDHTISFGGGE